MDDRPEGQNDSKSALADALVSSLSRATGSCSSLALLMRYSNSVGVLKLVRRPWMHLDHPPLRVTTVRPDCLAGHLGFELPNPSARYLTGIA
jgi:hypothetical protein